MEENNEVPDPQAGPARRRVLAWSLVAAGLLGGGMLAGTLPAGAQTATASPAATEAPAATPDSDADRKDGAGDGRGCPDKADAGRRGDGEETTA